MIKTEFSKLFIFIPFICLIIIILLLFILFGINKLQEENQIIQNEEEINLISEQIEYNVFKKLTGVNETLASIELIKKALLNPDNIKNKDHLISMLETIKLTTSSIIIYVMDKNGTVIISTKSDNYDLTGNNYFFRPYFKESIKGNNFIYSGVGVTTHKRGFYFSSPIKNIKKNNIIGVVVIKHDVDLVDKILKSKPNPIVLVSPEGVIFSSNIDKWKYKTLMSLSPGLIKKIKLSKQFSDKAIEKSLNIQFKNNRTRIDGKEFIIAKTQLKSLKWELISFNPEIRNYPLSKIQKIFITSIIITIIVFSVISFLLLILNERRSQSEKKYKLVVENANEGIVILQKGAKIIFFNDKILKIFECTGEELLTKNIFDFVHETDRENVKNIFNKRMKGEKAPKSYEIKIYTKYNNIKWVLVTAIKLFWQDNPTVLAFLSDISVRRLAEKALRESEQRYRLLVESMKEGLIIIDKRARISFVNMTFCNIIEKDINEVLGSKIEQVFNENDNINLLSYIGQIRDGVPSSYEWEWVDNQSKKRTCLVMPSTLLDENRKYFGSVIVFSDMTELKNLQDRLLRSEKMESIGRLAGGVAHDLNNILSGLVSIPDLLLHELPKKSPFRDSISTIKMSGEKAAAIVNDLLTLARRQVSKKKIINLNSIIKETINSHSVDRLINEYKHIEISYTQDKNLNNISGSKVHLENAVLNLISNAFEAMPSGGKLSIKTENKKILNVSQGINYEAVVLTIQDSGMGISESDCQKIFEPFYSKKIMGRSGTGLGLAIVWGTVKDHNGTIDVESKINEGTKFTLTFPVNYNQIEKQENEEIIIYKGAGQLVMVVDDLEIQRDLAKQILKKLNYKVVDFETGQEALKYIRNNEVDVVLLDMILENEMNGLEVYQNILKLKPKQKVIIVSGYAEKNVIEEVKRLGDINFLSKPYTVHVLAKAVWEELHNR